MAGADCSTPVPSPRFISVDVEITNICSNGCAMCPRDAIIRPAGMMSAQTFERLIAFLNDSRCLVTFSGMGDPLKHPQLSDFIHKASEAGHETGVVVHPASLLEKIKGRTGMERLIEFPPATITVSFPSLMKDIFEALCPGICLEDAIAAVFALKDSTSVPVRVSGILTGMNHDEGREFRRFWSAHRVGCWITRCHTRGGHLMAPHLVIPEKKPGIGEGACSLFLFHTFITWQGDILSCCHDLDGTTCLGNINELSHYTALIKTKEKLLNALPCPPFPLCSRCDEPLRNISLGTLPIEGSHSARRKFFGRISKEAGRDMR